MIYTNYIIYIIRPPRRAIPVRCGAALLRQRDLADVPGLVPSGGL